MVIFIIFYSRYFFLRISTTTNIHKNDTIEFVRSINSYSKNIQEIIAFCWSAKLFGAISRRRGKGQTTYLEVWVRLASINGSERDVMVFIGASSTKESTCTIAKVQSREHSTDKDLTFTTLGLEISVYVPGFTVFVFKAIYKHKVNLRNLPHVKIKNNINTYVTISIANPSSKKRNKFQGITHFKRHFFPQP